MYVTWPHVINSKSIARKGKEKSGKVRNIMSSLCNCNMSDNTSLELVVPRLRQQGEPDSSLAPYTARKASVLSEANSANICKRREKSNNFVRHGIF